MRIINVTERDATHGPVVLQLKKVVVYKYKKKRKTSVLGNHRVYLRSHNYLQGDTEGYTEASYLLTHTIEGERALTASLS